MKAKFISFLKNKKLSIPVGVVVLLIIIFSIGGNGNGIETVTVEQADFVQETRVSGKVKPLEEAELSFNTSGQVGEVLVNVGDEVRRGDVLARLDRGDLDAGLSEAQANLLLEQRQLSELQRGTRAEEIQVQRVRVQTAEATFDDTKSALVNAMKQGFTAADDLFSNDITQVFESPFSRVAKIFPIMNAPNADLINDQYWGINNMINEWRSVSVGLSVSSYSANDLQYVQGNLGTLRSYADQVAIAVSNFEAGRGDYTFADIEGFQADIASGRSALDSAISNVTSAAQAFANAQNNLQLEESSLALLESGSTAEDIAIQQARIAAGSARVSSARAQFDDSQIVAPFDGVIAKRSIDVGENVTSETEALVLVAENGLEIESYIPELLIRNVTVEDPAEVIFDAYPDRKFMGVVTSVDSKDTLRDGVTTYKTLLQMTDLDDTPVRIGMTVDILIEAFKKPDVLLVPSRAVVVDEEGNDYVLVDGTGRAQKRMVTLGERDTNGNREVLEGLQAGDVVVLNPEE